MHYIQGGTDKWHVGHSEFTKFFFSSIQFNFIKSKRIENGHLHLCKICDIAQITILLSLSLPDADRFSNFFRSATLLQTCN